MKIRHLLVLILFCGYSGVSLAAIPPEIPSLRTTQMFSPFYFEVGDNGENVVQYGGPKLQGYGVSGTIQASMPTLAKPEANLDTFLDYLGSPAGILFIASHGWNDKVCVEAYEHTEDGWLEAGAARVAYKNL